METVISKTEVCLLKTFRKLILEIIYYQYIYLLIIKAFSDTQKF